MSIKEQNLEELAANKDKPLVMAFIGDDDPHRGDSKGTIGIAKLVAQMIDGRYVYVDEQMLENAVIFNDPDTEGMRAHLCKADRIREKFYTLCKRIGFADVMIGTHARALLKDDNRLPGFKKPKVVESLINELISEDRLNKGGGFLSHHLSKELLYEEGSRFEQRYPYIKGDLCAVMMGGSIYQPKNEPSRIKYAARRLLEIGAHYDDITFFVCPSRRTKTSYVRLIESFADQLGINKHRYGFWDDVHQGIHFERDNIRIVGLSFDAAIEGYNPYVGLLGKADHIVQIGGSGSITSEALFTDKSIHSIYAQTATNLRDKGYVMHLDALEDCPFRTRKKLSVDTTYAVASHIANEFKLKAYGRITNVPAPLDVYETTTDLFGVPSLK